MPVYEAFNGVTDRLWYLETSLCAPLLSKTLSSIICKSPRVTNTSALHNSDSCSPGTCVGELSIFITNRDLGGTKQSEKQIMATGGFKSNSATDFLEEWKAKREKMRAKMLGDIAAATGRTTELNNNGSSVNCVSASSSYPVARSSSSTALKDEPKKPEPPGENLKKTPEKVSGVPQGESSSPAGVDDSDKESPTPSKSKEKKSSGPSARKGKGQIEKRKLREKRRSTGVVSIPSNEVSSLVLKLTISSR
ncbi:PRKC apoptosis WT1 regulator protein [Labeo rohita]|uniref:PRKC apoptosis WT1 regulator protein n=1 Tax=Labeo rohita TaxID=84645 RepID=A0ABQ8MR83_LABRO|nr:PRKC apoptosis WT1 regulator protein [Labeo rohita]